MQQNELETLISQAQNGDQLARERLIRHYKSYILNAVSKICKSFKTWSDEESSVGLLAFNHAIDTFKSTAGRTFLNYVYLLIQRDIIDYFRKESRNKNFSFDFTTAQNQTAVSRVEIEHSLQSFQTSIQTEELIHEILELSSLLQDFNIEFEELEHCSPKHKDTRKSLDEISLAFVDNKTFVDHFMYKKNFPVTAFVKHTGYRSKTVERHRKYLITLILIRLHPEWVHLTSSMITTSKKGDGHE